ncbi:MAG: class I SAM-dependent methyltransferase [Pseudomonadota bacterium]
MQNKATVSLTGVPETMLWPLHHRVAFSRRDPSLLMDPLAQSVLDGIDYDFEGHFGKANVGHAIRARYSDDLIRDFCEAGGESAIVVALGEGLETQAWRVNKPNQWISVDLPESIAVRQKFLPAQSHHTYISRSALDTTWIDELPDHERIFISAAGLLMYFEESAVKELLTTIGQRLPGAELFFDCIPPMFSARSMKGMKVTPKYTAPQMPWGISLDSVPGFLESCGWQTLVAQTYAHPFPKYMKPYLWLSKIGPIRRRLAPSLVHARAG